MIGDSVVSPLTPVQQGAVGLSGSRGSERGAGLGDRPATAGAPLGRCRLVRAVDGGLQWEVRSSDDADKLRSLVLVSGQVIRGFLLP